MDETTIRAKSEASGPRAFYSEQHRCWYVPMSAELWQMAEEDELQPVEPARVEMRDGELLITRLEDR